MTDRNQLGGVSIRVLADSDAGAAAANSRGHLFEVFVAKLLQSYGYEEPTTSHVNISANGIELDVLTRTRLDARSAIVECKAYSQSVPAKEISNFYGKLTVARFEDTGATGIFVAIPGVTSSGEEFARRISSRDEKFLYWDAASIAAALLSEGIISTRPDPSVVEPAGLDSDFTVVITRHGTYACVLDLDVTSRLPFRVSVWAAKGSVPQAVLDLLSRDAFTQGLPVVDARAENSPGVRHRDVTDEVLLATVVAAKSDFQYQLPAGPKFFVGRKTALDQLNQALSDGVKVVVLNAQSGWGKSSLALKFSDLVTAAGGFSLVMDTRTASTSRYIIEVLRRAFDGAAKKGILRLAAESSWASLPSAIQTMRDAQWIEHGRPVVIFFDQFENIFRSPALTQAFRDLALGVQDIDGEVVVGFSWKTDLVGWIEGHPYQYREEIRSSSRTVLVEPFGSSEVSTLIDRLERAVTTKLGRDLRNRLREYSQGLPWLLKKLADHVLRELKGGSTAEQLLADGLNVQGLFDLDLAQLEPESLEILKHVARYAPISAGEVTDKYAPEAVQALVDRRLIVQIGDRLDTYWDTFRDYLNTGRVPIEDTYILRSAPNQVARLLPLVINSGGSVTVSELAQSLATSENVIFNLSRELRLLGVTQYEPLTVKISESITAADDPEAAVRQKVISALSRHRALSAVTALSQENDGYVTSEEFARVLPGVFPAVAVTDGTWVIYARVFLGWFEYAGFASRRGNHWRVESESGAANRQRLLSHRPVVRSRPSVPQEAPRLPLALLRRVVSGEAIRVPEAGSSDRKSLLTLLNLGVVRIGADGFVAIANSRLIDASGGLFAPAMLAHLIEAPGGRAAMDLLEGNPGATPAEVGETIREFLGAKWTASSTHSIGGHFRSWAKQAGATIVSVPRAAGRSI